MLCFSTWLRSLISIWSPDLKVRPTRSGLRGPLHRLQVRVRSRDHVVQRIALVRFTAGVTDEAADRLGRHPLGRLRSGHVVNVLFLDGTVEVIRTEPQRQLGRFDAG